MKVQIVGGGAVGLLLASFFVQSNISTKLICRREKQVQALSNGLHFTTNEGVEKTLLVDAQTNLEEDADLTIIAVKSTDLQLLLPQLKKEKALLFCQNGLSHFDFVNAQSFSNVAFASAQFGATRTSDNAVIHNGKGVLKCAIHYGEQKMLTPLEMVTYEDFMFEQVEHAEAMLLEKALINSLINPLTAILQIKNGELLTNKVAYRLLVQMHAEFEHVFKEANIAFSRVVQVCENTANNTSSMLMDHLHKKKSEAPAIIGALLQRVQKSDVVLPTLHTLYQLILARELAGGFVE